MPLPLQRLIKTNWEVNIMLVVTAKQMTEIENSAFEKDMPPLRLMENAGSAAANVIDRIYTAKGLDCAIFCGTGNNGGDGFVVARRLYEKGATVVVVLVGGTPATPQSSEMLKRLEPFNIPIITMENKATVENYAKHASVLVDSIFGIGYQDRGLPDEARSACQIINSAKANVVALDIPSGITADRGDVSFGGVKANYTIAFQLMKPVHMLPASKQYCGQVETVDIGIPKKLYENVESYYNIIKKDWVLANLPKREKNAHKGNFGRLLLICGSEKYPGAATLSTLGALRVGTGICCVAGIPSVCQAVASHIPEAIFQPLPVNQQGELDYTRALPLLQQELSVADAVVFGCGSGNSPQSQKVLEYLLNTVNLPILIDADGLNMLAENPKLMKKTKAPLLLTPHPGEMARLNSTNIKAVESNRISVALEFARKHKVTLVLKGSKTLVAQWNGRLHENTTGNNGLATGGSGDLLAGMIGGFIAQGLPLAEAAAVGVWLHGAAADRCANRISPRGMLPTDIIQDLLAIFAQEK